MKFYISSAFPNTREIVEIAKVADDLGDDGMGIPDHIVNLETLNTPLGPRAGLAALWLAALCPFTAMYCAAPLTETLSVFCVAWRCWPQAGGYVLSSRALVGCWRWQLPWTTRFCCGRTEGSLAAAFLCWREERFGMAKRTPTSPAYCWLACSAAAPLAPWAWRNWHVFHVFQPLAPRYANNPE